MPWTLDTWLGATKQRVRWGKTATRTTIANTFFSVFDLAGQPGAGTLAGSNTANGVVPTDATAGYPLITSFSGTEGALGRVAFGNTVASRIILFDRLFLAGAYSFNSNVTLASQPSYSGRLPGGSYNDTEIWVETVTAATGNLTVTATYTDQDGTAGATTGAVGIGAAPTIGRCWQLPLASGDSGVQKIESVVGGVASAGTFNVMVLRRLCEARILVANSLDRQSMIDTGGLIRLYDTSSLYVLVCADSTSSGLPDVDIVIGNATP